MTSFALLATLVLPACLTQDNFERELAYAECARDAACASDWEFESVESCVGFQYGSSDSLIDFECLQQCEFDSEQAELCLDETRVDECQSFVADSCNRNKIYDCPAGTVLDQMAECE